MYGTGFLLLEDGGQTWKNASRGLGSRSLSCLSAPGGSLDTLFPGTGDAGLFVSRDGGATWNAIVLPFESQPIVTSMDIDPADELRLAVTVTGGGTGLSRDGGRTWVASSKGSLPSDCAAVQFLPDGAPGLVLGTQSGALYFSADGLDWQLTSQLPEGGTSSD